ncbi:glycosyltransferase [Algibacter sp.]|nr:glycosyltransferase [Algibacter sp.]
MKKQSILIFINWFLPGFKAGGPIQSVSNLVRHLGDTFDFSIVTSNKDLGDKQPYENLICNSWIDRDHYRIIYLDNLHQNIKHYKKLMAEQSYHAVYLNSLFSFSFTILPLITLRKSKIKIVLAPRGMLGEGALNIKKRKKQVFLCLLKSSGIVNKITWQGTAMSEVDEIKQRIGKDMTVKLAPNLSAKMLDKTNLKEKTKERLNLFFLSRIATKKNLKAALTYLLHIKKSYTIQFTIIGPIDESGYWHECQNIISKMPDNVSVNYKGAVPNKDLAQYLSSQHFMLLPTFHENFGHVIMESWQYACPVIISDMTPWRSLESKKIGWDIPLNSPEEFITAIEAAAQMDQETYNEWSVSSFNFAKKFCNNEGVLKANKELFK